MSTDPKTIEWYNENAEGYTRHVQTPDESIYHAYYEKPAMYALLPDLKGKSVISLGSGPGEDSNYLKVQGAARSVGIDISEKLAEIAQANYPDCEFRVMDMEQLDFSDASFDLAYSSLALHYIKDWSRVMAEAYRILKPGGVFLFSCEHPVVSSMSITGEHKGETWSLRVLHDRDTRAIEVEGDYLHQHRTGTDWNEAVVTWHRPMSQLFTEVLKPGFILAHVVEPRPLPEMEKIKPEVYKALNLVPEFLIIKLEKPV